MTMTRRLKRLHIRDGRDRDARHHATQRGLNQRKGRSLAGLFACALVLWACTSGHGADSDAGGPSGEGGSAGSAGSAADGSGSAGTAGEPGAGDGGSELDASVLAEGMPECVDGVLQLASSFHLQREVEYIADKRGDQVFSEVGTACVGARDMELCEAAIAASTLGIRHLLTTEGDKILQWDGSSAINLLGAIDTVGEALWLSEAFDYGVDCETKVTFAEDLFIVRDAYAHWGCAEPQALVTVVVTPEGGVSEVRAQPLNANTCSAREGVSDMFFF